MCVRLLTTTAWLNLRNGHLGWVLFRPLSDRRRCQLPCTEVPEVRDYFRCTPGPDVLLSKLSEPVNPTVACARGVVAKGCGISAQRLMVVSSQAGAASGTSCHWAGPGLGSWAIVLGTEQLQAEGRAEAKACGGTLERWHDVL